MCVQGLIKKSNVTLICTTDDPVDSLEWHKQLATEQKFETKVLPAWRPDKAMNIENADYLKYLSTLEEASGKTISSPLFKFFPIRSISSNIAFIYSI